MMSVCEAFESSSTALPLVCIRTCRMNSHISQSLFICCLLLLLDERTTEMNAYALCTAAAKCQNNFGQFIRIYLNSLTTTFFKFTFWRMCLHIFCERKLSFRLRDLVAIIITLLYNPEYLRFWTTNSYVK